MRPITSHAVFLLTLLSAATIFGAGCLQEQEPWRPTEQLHGFYTVYRDDAGNLFEFILDGPHAVTALSGDQVQAYKLTKQVKDDASRQTHSWLDNQLVQLRHDITCFRVEEDECVQAEASWDGGGKPSELGLDVPYRYRTGQPLEYNLRGSWETILPDVEVHEGHDVFHLNWSTLGPSIWHGQQSRYTYERGILAPVDISIPSGAGEPYNLQRVEYEPRAALAPILYQFQHETPQGPVREGLLFPGEETIPFDLGFSHLEMATALLRAVGWNDLARDDEACIGGYVLRPQPSTARLDDASPARKVAELTIHAAHGSGPWHAWTGDIRRFFGSMEVTNVRYAEPIDGRCDALQRATWPRYPADEMLERADGMLSRIEELISFHYYTSPTHERHGNDSIAWHRYMVTARPDYTAGWTGTYGFQPYQLTVTANDGGLAQFEEHPETVAEFG